MYATLFSFACNTYQCAELDAVTRFTVVVGKSIDGKCGALVLSCLHVTRASRNPVVHASQKRYILQTGSKNVQQGAEPTELAKQPTMHYQDANRSCSELQIVLLACTRERNQRQS